MLALFCSRPSQRFPIWIHFLSVSLMIFLNLLFCAFVLFLSSLSVVDLSISAAIISSGGPLFGLINVKHKKRNNKKIKIKGQDDNAVTVYLWTRFNIIKHAFYACIFGAFLSPVLPKLWFQSVCIQLLASLVMFCIRNFGTTLSAIILKADLRGGGGGTNSIEAFILI